MGDEWSEIENDPWRVTFRPGADERIVLLSIGDTFAVSLPALSAHKLGSALHAASGIETEVMGESMGARIKREGEAAREVLIRRMADEDAGPPDDSTRTSVEYDGLSIDPDAMPVRELMAGVIEQWFPDDDAPYHKVDELLAPAIAAGYEFGVTAAMVTEWCEIALEFRRRGYEVQREEDE